MKQQDKIFMIVGGTAVLVAAGVTGTWLFVKSDKSVTNVSGSAATTQTGTTMPTTSTNSTSIVMMPSMMTWKDGTYKATISYSVPRGATNTVTATVTISSDKVSALTVSDSYSDRESGMYVDSFESEVKSAVVGQSISNLSFSRIGGASLTTQAFDDALATIRTEAKA